MYRDGGGGHGIVLQGLDMRPETADEALDLPQWGVGDGLCIGAYGPKLLKSVRKRQRGALAQEVAKPVSPVLPLLRLGARPGRQGMAFAIELGEVKVEQIL